MSMVTRLHLDVKPHLLRKLALETLPVEMEAETPPEHRDVLDQGRHQVVPITRWIATRSRSKSATSCVSCFFPSGVRV